MSWLHCFWGVGCSCGPYVMSYFLKNGQGWNKGYTAIFVLQAVLSAVLLISLPLWKKKSEQVLGESGKKTQALGLKRTIAILGVKEMMISFYNKRVICYVC